MKKFSFISLILILFFLVGCSKRMEFEVPNSDIEIIKNPFDCSNEGIEYKPLIITNDKKKEELINELNNWKLVSDNKMQKDTCILYEITWENHSVTIYGVTEIGGVVIDKKSYDVINGNMAFFDNYVFEELD